MMWYRKLAEDAHNMSFNQRLAWQKINEISKVLSGHNCEPEIMRMKLYTNKNAVNDEENMSVFNLHFVRVFNNYKEIDVEILHKLKQYETLCDLDEIIITDEFDSAVASLTNCKIPGLNEVPPEAHENLDNDDLDYLFNLILQFWNDEGNFEE